MAAHTQAQERASKGCLSSFFESDKPHLLGMPAVMADLLQQPLLSGWYAADSPQEQQAKRAGLLLSETTDEWFAMGWTVKQITKVARQLLTARARWIDGITIVRRAVEQHIRYVGQRVAGSAQALDGPRWLSRPLHTQCLGLAERLRSRVPVPLKVGWVGAAQLGPFDDRQYLESNQVRNTGAGHTRT